MAKKLAGERKNAQALATFVLGISRDVLKWEKQKICDGMCSDCVKCTLYAMMAKEVFITYLSIFFSLVLL